MAEPQFVHLRLHSDFSLVDGVVRHKALTATCQEKGIPAVGLTDDSNLFALVKFYNAARSAGVKPIMGADLWLESTYLGEPMPVTALAMNATGYHHLVLLISRAWQHNQQGERAVIKPEWIEEWHDGLIWLTGSARSELGQLLLQDKPQEAKQLAQRWQALCPNRFYLEVMRTNREGDETCLHQCVALAEQLQLPVVATNDVRFLKAEDFDAHEARVCIHDSDTLEDPRRPKRYSDQQYLKSADEMAALFDDLPEALANSVEIAKRCSLTLELGKNYLPDFPIPDGMSIDEFIRDESQKGLDEKLADIIDPTDPQADSLRQRYQERLEFELDIILQMGFPGYFLIVSDFIRWAKQNGVPVGPGRGSGAGSVVAWCLHITDLDPIEYDLLFERFLNPERVSMPDFDVDFCMDNRDRVIQYVADAYGHDAVSQIVTFGTMAAKAVVRDVARVQGKPYGLADKLSKMIPGTPGMTLAKAIEEEQTLHDFLYLQDSGNSDQEAANEIMDMAFKLEGLARNTGKHAGGVVIAPGKLTDFAPLYCEPDGSNLVTQYDKNDVEAAGLVKFDFLGLKTLTVIDWALQAINKRKPVDEQVDISTIPLDDEPTFELLKRGDTTAVFQLEGSGMKELIKKLKPDVFGDIIALVALYRPGPLESGMVDNFVKRKHGEEALAWPDPNYQHECLQPILESTYGVILYQEQVMQIAQVMAGYSLGEADILRRAMGKKKLEEMAKQRDVFKAGAVKNGIDAELAMKIFDLVEKFAGYGFNKSHSACYALVAYQTAWLKVHYPAEFMAAVISADMQNTDKVVTFINECHEMGLTVRPPAVNECQHHFTVNDAGEVVFGLGAIKGLGEGPVDAIVSGRESGPFKDLFDFCRRVDQKRINRRSLEALVQAGALDLLGPNGNFDDRATLLATLPDAIKAAQQEASNQAAGMLDMFGNAEADTANIAVNWIIAKPWRDDRRLNGEKDTLGLFLTGHPIDQYEHEVRAFVGQRLDKVQPTEKHQHTIIAGLVVELRIARSKKNGNKMAFLTLDDKRGRLDVSVFGRTFAEYGHLIEKDELLVAVGGIRYDDYSGGHNMIADELLTITEARQRFARQITLNCGLDEQLPEQLQRLLQPWQGGNSPVMLNLQSEKARFALRLGKAWDVTPEEALLDQLREQLGKDAVQVEY